MSAARVGEQREVEWKFVYRSPFFAMRSRAGVGTTPPNVPGAPKPASSVMMSSTLGAPFGGTTRGAHHALDSAAFSLITPPKVGSGGGSCFPLIEVVASGEPGVAGWPLEPMSDAFPLPWAALDEPDVPVAFGAPRSDPHPARIRALSERVSPRAFALRPGQRACSHPV